MLKKVYRLSENDVKKVLKYSKPFFSYGIVANSIKNNLLHNRYAIVIGGKSVDSAISRNYFRRLFYKLVENNLEIKQNDFAKDIVFVIKKQIKLDKKDYLSIKSFEKDINFLLKKI